MERSSRQNHWRERATGFGKMPLMPARMIASAFDNADPLELLEPL